MKNKRSETLAQWLDRFPAAEAIPFRVNRRRLYRIPELYKGYN